jgi:hypothetical protein
MEMESLELRVRAVSALIAESEAPVRHGQSTNDRAKEPFGQLTVLTDHDTQETDFQKHIYNIAFRYMTSYSYTFMTL